MTISRAGVLRALRGRQVPVRQDEGGGPVSTVVAVSVLVTVAVILVCGLLWRLERGSWAVIETGSMGRAAPVGTLILTHWEPPALIQVGDVVSYHPRQNPQQIITHRVIGLDPDGLVVRGDINGAADPFPVREQDLVGTVVARLIGVGWLVKALPYLVVAGVLVAVATRLYVPPYWRSTVRVLAACLLVCLAILVLRPFVHPILIEVRNAPDTLSMADVVSGGLLPTRVDGMPGHHVDLTVGQTGSVAVESASPGAPFRIMGHPNLDLPWLLLVTLVCALPFLWCLVVGLSPEEEGT